MRILPDHLWAAATLDDAIEKMIVDRLPSAVLEQLDR
jgi:hypothetical protein